MKNTNNPISPEYDTSINVIGGLQGISIIFKAIDAYFSESGTLNDLFRERNELNLRTERSRTRVHNAIKASFLVYKNEGHRSLAQNIFTRNDVLANKELIQFWQYSLLNRLFREISTQVFCKAYFSGRAGLSKEDIVAYLKEFLNQNKQLGLGWSESTVQTLSTKYLNLMTKLNLLEGARIKSFKYVRPSSEDMVLFLYFANPAAQQILGKTNALLHGFPVARVLADWNPEAFHAWNAGKEEVQLIIGQEEAQYFRLATSKLAVNSGEPIGSLLTFYNNTDQKNYEKRLNELASCDPLTGIYNRRYFFEMAHIYFNQMLRSSKPLSLIMLDLDHFKNINDTFGHLKGDLVIQQVVAVCIHLVRNQDIFSRYGGEEFILAMPETSLRDALLVAERLRKAIEALNNEADGFPITASLGVVESYGETGLTLDGLIYRADEAMYLSKHAGRNCVTAWTDK